jgi:hypothetical protein
MVAKTIELYLYIYNQVKTCDIIMQLECLTTASRKFYV